MDDYSGLPVSLPEICAPRKELLRRIDRAAERQIICIQAPGGYGKTVTTLLWLKQTNCHAAWHCFDEYDNTPALFYMAFCRLLSSATQRDTQRDKDISGLINATGFRDTPVEFTIELLATADFGRERVVLVIDDFHKINNATIIKSLPHVLKRLPENITVIFLSRTGLPDTFDILRNVNKVSMVDSSELAFSVDEIMKYLASYGQFATEQKAQEIRVYSEGWIILINSMITSGNLQMDEKKSLLSYKTYFEKNVWNNMNEKKRKFLMQSAVPDKFTADLCALLTGVKDCKGYIDILIQGNANISVSGGVYRYHDLFREFLLEELAKSQIDKAELYRKTAQYYLSMNDFYTARRYAFRSRDIPVIAESFKKTTEDKNKSMDEYIESLKVFLEGEFSDEICEKLPILYASQVVYQYYSGNAPKFEFYMDRMKAAVPVLARDFPQVMEAVMSCFMMDYRIKYAEIAAMISRAPAAVQNSGKQQIGSSTFYMPFLHRSGRDFYALAKPEVYEMVATGVNKVLLKENSECLSLGILAGLYIEQNALNEASQVFSQARSALNAEVSHEIGYAIILGQAEAALLNGNRNAYELHLNEAGTYVETNSAHHLKQNLLAYKTKRGLLDGDKKTAEQWLSNYYVNDSNLKSLYKVYQSITTARAYIVLGKLDEAFSALQAVKSMADAMDRPLDGTEADVLISIIEWAIGKKKESADRLLKRIPFLQTYGFIRVVANDGKAVLPVLSAVIRKLGKETDSDDATSRFVRELYVTTYEQSKRFKGVASALKLKPVKLSKQQTLVLELLSKGHNNAKIVKLTGLSLNTIRYHTKLAYQKLDVTNAMDAIVKARQLGLLR